MLEDFPQEVWQELAKFFEHSIDFFNLIMVSTKINTRLRTLTVKFDKKGNLIPGSHLFALMNFINQEMIRLELRQEDLIDTEQLRYSATLIQRLTNLNKDERIELIANLIQLTQVMRLADKVVKESSKSYVTTNNKVLKEYAEKLTRRKNLLSQSSQFNLPLPDIDNFLQKLKNMPAGNYMTFKSIFKSYLNDIDSSFIFFLFVFCILMLAGTIITGAILSKKYNQNIFKVFPAIGAFILSGLGISFFIGYSLYQYFYDKNDYQNFPIECLLKEHTNQLAEIKKIYATEIESLLTTSHHSYKSISDIIWIMEQLLKIFPVMPESLVNDYLDLLEEIETVIVTNDQLTTEMLTKSQDGTDNTIKLDAYPKLKQCALSNQEVLSNIKACENRHSMWQQQPLPQSQTITAATTTKELSKTEEEPLLPKNEMA